MKGIIKFIVGIGVGITVLNLLPEWISSPWLRVPIFASCVGIICLWDEFKDDCGNVGGALASALVGVLLLGFWVLIGWAYGSFSQWIGKLSGNENIGPYLYVGILALAFVVGVALAIAGLVYRMRLRRQLPPKPEKTIEEQLAEVKGNWLKKEMIAKRLRREQAEREKLYTSPNDKVASMFAWAGCLTAPVIFGTGFSILVLLLLIVWFVDFKTLYLINTCLALVAAGILTFRRHAVLAFCMWMLFFFCAFGVWSAGNDLLGIAGPMLAKYEAMLFFTDSQAGLALQTGHLLIMATTVCAAAYTWVNKWAIPLWVVSVLAITWSICQYYPTWPTGLFAATCGLRAIVSATLGIPYWLTFLLCGFYLYFIVVLACALRPAIAGWRIATQAGMKKTPAVIGSLWLLVHIGLFVIVWLAIDASTIENSAKYLRMLIMTSSAGHDDFGNTFPVHTTLYTWFLPLDLAASWLLFQTIKKRT